MTAVTVRHSPAKPKPFTWSYSKLKNFETCPKRHWHLDIARDVKEEESEQLKWGNYVHAQLAKRIKDGTPLPRSMESYNKWCERILADAADCDILVEQKLAITQHFEPCGYFDQDVWFRGVGDVIKCRGSVALIVDWKTGKILDDHSQLSLMAACVFAHRPDVHAVRSEFIWLKEDAQTSDVFRRDDMPKMWGGLLHRVNSLRLAFDTQSYPAKPSGLCKRFCPVEQCPHHGE